jgi:hypothetical protein
MAKGNRTLRRGHRGKVGGPESEGSTPKTVRVDFETLLELEKSRVGKDKPYRSFQHYVRSLIERDLSE